MVDQRPARSAQELGTSRRTLGPFHFQVRWRGHRGHRQGCVSLEAWCLDSYSPPTKEGAPKQCCCGRGKRNSPKMEVLRDIMEAKAGRRLAGADPVTYRMIRCVAILTSRYSVGKDGRGSFERRRRTYAVYWRRSSERRYGAERQTSTEDRTTVARWTHWGRGD